MAVSPADRARRRGLGLPEVVAATFVVSVGLLGTAGLLHLAARETALARRAEVAQWAATAVADSILAGRLAAEGERTESWGLLRWGLVDGTVTLEALRDEAPDRAPYIRIHIPLARAGEGES